MSILGRGLQGESAVTLGTRITSMAVRTDGAWTVLGQQGHDYGPFAGVIVTSPAPQAADLLADVSPNLARECREVEMLPCWATMVAFESPLRLDFDAAFMDDEVLAWTANESTKPGRSAQPECWTLHAAPVWSRDHLEDDPHSISRTMVERFFDIAAVPSAEPTTRIAHRWRFARSAEPRVRANLLDPVGRVGVAGDWTRGDRLEGAFMSGLRMADQLADLVECGGITAV
jgi:predicted NAD/FAD-dependent oxidoreductase